MPLPAHTQAEWIECVGSDRRAAAHWDKAKEREGVCSKSQWELTSLPTGFQQPNQPNTAVCSECFYINIYICVCVCVCVSVSEIKRGEKLGVRHREKIDSFRQKKSEKEQCSKDSLWLVPFKKIAEQASVCIMIVCIMYVIIKL